MKKRAKRRTSNPARPNALALLIRAARHVG
jgi:hypothetical protein